MLGRAHAWNKVVAAFAAAVLVAAAACTNDPAADGGGPGTSDDAPASGDRTGVTAEVIRIGWPTLDQATLIDAGLATDGGDLDALADAIVADWNAGDGVGGRKVELVKRSFGADIANLLADMQGICLELAEDEEVFATAAISWFGDAVTCLAGDHQMPLVSGSSMASSVVDSGDGNIFLTNFIWEDALRSAVRVVDEAGELDDFEMIGVFGPLEPGMRAAIDDGLVPALDEAGATLAADGTIPFSAVPDAAAAAAVVSRFKAEGVDAVFAVGNFFVNGQFMTEAERQGYKPTYVMSDLSEGTDDLILRFAPAEQLANAIGASWKGKPPEPVPTEEGQACVETYAPAAVGTTTQEVGAAQVCELLELVRRGLENAGDDPTREGFIAGMGEIGAFTTSGGGAGSFGSDDHTMPDQVRLVRFDLDGCQCWAADGDWVDVDG